MEIGTNIQNDYSTFLEDLSIKLVCDPDNEVILKRVHALMKLAVEVADAYDSKPDYWCSCSQCENFKEHAQDILNGDYWRTK